MEWLILVVYGGVLWWIAPGAPTARGFFRGTDREGRPVGFWLLTGSVFISWIFAKSITNAANLGARFGLVGGLAYAAWFLSIPVAGVVIHGIRSRRDVVSLPDFVNGKYGRTAALLFLGAVFIRLFNEVWSNTMVVGTYFGPKGSNAYYGACLLFTVMTLVYSLRGGLRSSILTDALQALLMVFFTGLVLAVILPGRSTELLTAGELSLRGGVDLMLVGLLQSLSYPFHDPVLTDRAFIAPRATTLRSYLVAGLLGVCCIVLFSLVGVYALTQGLPVGLDDVPPRVATSLGVTVMGMMNLIMLSSAGSTLDSTFAALAREAVLDLPRTWDALPGGSLSAGRVAMVAMALVGNLPLLSGATILQATTVSGTMVMGLAPIFLGFWWNRPGALSFHLAFLAGLALGVYEIVAPVPAALHLGDGAYGGLLAVNLLGLGVCTGLYVMGAYLPILYRGLRAGSRVEAN